MSANDTAAAADTTNDEVLVGISTAASALFLVLFIAGFTVIILLFINAKKKFNSHHENVDTKTFDIQHKLQQILKNTKSMLDQSHRAMDEWKRTDENRKVMHHAPPQLLKSYPEKTIVTPHAAEQIQQQTYASINRRHRSNSASSLPKQEPASQRTYTFEDRGAGLYAVHATSSDRDNLIS